jgi:molecular chaperone DnaK (HSP70)
MAVMTLPIAVDTVAIDFGTTNTVVCILDPVTNTPKTLKFPYISRTILTTTVIPSLVFIAEDGTCICGERVRSQRLGYDRPQRLFQGFKREMVAEFRASPIQIDGIIYTAEAIAQLFLQTIWQEILTQYQPKQVIFTAPVGAFESYLAWFRQLASSLELPVMQIIDESTAAALGYAITGASSLVLVIDFGGGTLDLSLVRTAKSDRHAANSSLKAEVIAKSDAYIGGIDIDTWIGEYFLTQLGITKSQIGNTGWLNLLEIAERMKIQLSTVERVAESWFDDENFIAYELKLNQADLADILESRLLIEQVRQVLDEVLAIAHSKGVSKLEIQQVLMVGGSSQIRAVQNLAISYFGKSRVRMDKPFEAIAIGALAVGQFEAIEDHLRHAYGIRLWDNFTKSHYYHTLFEKGIRYPCDRPEPLILQVANSSQAEIRLDIGELADHAEIELSYDPQGRMTSSKIQRHSDFRSLIHSISQNSSLQNLRSSFICKLNPAAEMGIDRLEVRLGINVQRVLIATVKDLLTQKILIKEQAIAQLD